MSISSCIIKAHIYADDLVYDCYFALMRIVGIYGSDSSISYYLLVDCEFEQKNYYQPACNIFMAKR